MTFSIAVGVVIEIVAFSIWALSLLGYLDLRLGLAAVGSYVFWKSLADGWGWHRFAANFQDALDDHVKRRVSPILARLSMALPNSGQGPMPEYGAVVGEIQRWFEAEYDRPFVQLDED